MFITPCAYAMPPLRRLRHADERHALMPLIERLPLSAIYDASRFRYDFD